MLTVDEAMEIRVLMRQGMSIRSIARTLGMSRNTVRKYVRAEDILALNGPRVGSSSIGTMSPTSN